MSSKKLFDSQKINDALVSTSLEEEVVKNAPELESADNVREQIERVNRFIPHVEFSDPNNFAYYGSAKAYYEDAITRITNTFPYDGSEEEITRFHNESNYLDKYIFDKKYPRTNGHIKFPTDGHGSNATANLFGPNLYSASVTFFGGPNAIAGGMTTDSFHLQFTGSNYYDTDIYQTDGTLALDRVGSRESNLAYNLPSKGLTVEFWQGSQGVSQRDTGFYRQARHALFDLWNGEPSSSAQYGRLTVYASGSRSKSAFHGIYLNAYSGTVGIQELCLLTGTVAAQVPPQYEFVTTPTPGHLAFAFSSGSTLGLTVKTYINGFLTTTTGSSIALNEVTGALRGRIGALLTAPSGNNGVTAGFEAAGKGTSIGSAYDEFRYWKAERTEKEIQQNYWTQVRGGTNNEIANAELGVYFKFNEGITGDATTDATALDYSGRITNGTITNYLTSSVIPVGGGSATPGSGTGPQVLLRDTGSLIVDAEAATSEYKDPIIYDTHTDVKTLFSDLSTTGSVHDHQNQTSLMDSMPGWIRDDEDENGAGELERLTQIVGSYFDTLQLQVQNLPKLKDNTYLSSSFKPTPFTNRMLSSAGLHVPEIFVDATLLERFANKSADEEYASDINEIKSTIYQNIYNNLIYIYKSKGTEKAFRNLMHCYGISDDVVQFNAYGNNTTFKLEDTRQSTVVRKNYVDFNDPKRWTGTVFQNSASIGHFTSDTTYVSGTNKNFANTAEIEVMFPRQRENSDPEFFHTGFLSSSVFGHHKAADDPGSFAWDGTAGNDKNYQLYAVRTGYNSKDAYFVLKDRAGNFSLESPVYSNVYDNQKWNFAIRVKDAKWPQSDGPRGDGGDVFFADDDIQIECYGVNVDAGIVRNEFTLTKTGLADEYLTDKRRYYVGADRTNFKSTVVTNSDIQASSFRFYSTYLDNSVVKAHALDPENYGTKNPTRNTVFGVSSPSYTNDNHTFNEAVSLAINWDFSEVTTADSIGEFSVQDASSGSVSLRTRYDNDENLSHIVGNQYYAQGYFPDSTATAERSKVISKQYVQSERQNLPEVVSTSDAVNVLSRDDEFFPRDPAVSQTFFAFEKSMYGIVSQEMLKMFSTIVEFNDLIGDLTNKYREDYKGLRLLRHLFFEKIENSPDLDKFIDYYKWIDSSLSIFLQQLVPASANVSDEIRVMVEDHILGRSKYRHQYPHLDYKGNERWGGDEAKLEARVKRFAELDYNWQFGHAPLEGTAATLSLRFTDKPNEASTITITDSFGTSVTFEIDDTEDGVSGSNTAVTEIAENGGGAVGTSVDLAAKINASALRITATLPGSNTVAMTQQDIGSEGNTAITTNDNSHWNTALHGATQLPASFTGGTLNHTKNSLWWKERAKRDREDFNTATAIDNARRDLNDIILSFNSGSAELLNTGAGATGTYLGSAYATRRFTRPLKLTVDIVDDIGGGYNYPRGQKPDALFPVLPTGDASSSRFEVKKIASSDIAAAELRPTIKQEKRSVPAVVPNVITKVGDDLENNKYLVPFVAYSSSASPTDGFGQSWQSTDTTLLPSAEESAGYHNDSYGDDYEVPMQGPFTNQHVGGNRHRHTDLNTGSAPDTHLTRPEAWNQYPNIGYTRFVAADTKAGSISTNPQYRRDQTAKRPVNIKNIKHRTGSMGLIAGGNFNKRYEIVQTSDRSINNSQFVKSEGFSTASITPSTDAYVDGLTDYAKPVRARTEHVIVERFSAPGDPATAGDSSGGPGMDYEAGQFSPYNNLNYRNLSVREPLRTLLTERSQQFGLRSGSSVQVNDYTVNITASYHKVNRNGIKRLSSPTAADFASNPVYLTSSFDNYYVQHMIPRTDYQYAWITASYVSTNNEIYGYLPYNGLVSASAGDGTGMMISAINFSTASEVGITVTSGQRHTSINTVGGANFVPLGYSNMNTVILEPLSASSLTTGYPLTTSPGHYYNYSNIDTVDRNTPAFGGYVQKIGTTAAAKGAQAAILQSLNSHRNGPFGHPTWKQIRVGQSQLARHLRKSNLYTHTFPSTGDQVVKDKQGGDLTIRPRFGETMIVSQSVVTDRYLPMVFDLEMKTGKTRRGRELTTPVIIQSTYANGLVKFENKEFANKLGLGVDFRNSPYKQIRKMYTRGALNDPSSPITAVNRVIYKEVVYPSLANAQTNKTRGRTNYLNDFWRDSRSDRCNITASLHATDLLHPAGTKDKPVNTSGITLTQSIWSLDGPEVFDGTSARLLNATGGVKGNNDPQYRTGELQNKYVHFLNRDTPNDAQTPVVTAHRRPGILYARKHIFPATASVAPSWGMRSTIALAGQHARVPTRAVDLACMTTASIGLGEAVWDAPTQAGRYEGTSSTFITKAQTPFYDGYDEYFADIKAPGQGYSIVPEFRITDHLDFYNNKSGKDFLTDNLKALQIIGTPSGTVVPQNSDEDKFYTTFTNSDFLKYFEVVKKDHKGLINPANLTLKCRAIKKFVPYDGFYPAERTIQMATAFSQSYASWIAYDGTDGSLASAFNTFSKPLFGPGILYNTIKAGLAVDYPIMTGSFQTLAMHAWDGAGNAADQKIAYAHASASFAIASNSTSASYHSGKFNVTTGEPQAGGPSGGRSGQHTDGWDYRIPFEALVQPEKYLANRTIVHDEPSIFGAQNTSASWSGYRNTDNYRNMMHNFLAESISFFLQNGRTTEIVSRPQDEWEPMTPGQPYGMRIKLYRSMSGSTNPSAFNSDLSISPELLGDRKLVPQVSGAWGAFSVPQNIPGWGESNFEMYSRPSAFGPPVATGAGRDAINATYSITGALEFGPSQGVYASHTPPYYDGESWVDIIYYPAREVEEAAFQASANENFTTFNYADDGAAFVPTLDDIFGLATIAPSGSTVFSPMGSTTDPVSTNSRFGGKGTYVVKWRFDQQALNAAPVPADTTLNKTYKVSNSTNGRVGPMAGPYANKWCMQGDASLNLFGQKGDRWKISTKFETPMLNFKYLTESDLTRQTQTVALSPNGQWNQTIPRGMWHQFGRRPIDVEGVYLQVTDIPDTWLENNPASHIMNDPVGKIDLRNRFDMHSYQLGFAGTNDQAGTDTTSFALTPSGSTSLAWESALSGYRFPIGGLGLSSTTNPELGAVTERPKSLVDICGFDTQPVRVGKIRQKKFVHEAVVAVPYVEQDGERKFFNIMSPDSAAFNSFAGKSVKRQVRLMEKYVFPPAMDFVHNEDVPSIAMYIFEFKHKFDTDDLSHIWQNLTPRTGRKGEYATSTFTHRLMSNQLLADHTEGLAEAVDDDTTGIYHSGLPENLQWMVFKVKQRAHKDYFEKIGIKELEETNTVTTSRSFIDEDGNPSTISESSTTTTKVPYESEIPFYTDNWPYDHFSLVELLKVEAHVTFAKTIEKPKSAIESLESGEIEKEDAVVQTGTPTGGVPSSLTGLN